MTASNKHRKWYERAPKPAHKLTYLKMEVLRSLALSQFLTTRHVQGIHGFSEKAARGHLRDLYDMGLIDRMPVQGSMIGKAALLDADLHFPTREGIKKLELSARPGDGTPQLSAHSMPHEFAVRDALVWLACSARSHAGHAVETWDCSGTPLCGAKMDALFVYRLAESGVAVGFLEVDMGTERGTAGSRTDRWGVKIAAYGEAFADTEHKAIKAITGGRGNARLVITVPTPVRANWIMERLRGTAAGQYAWIGVQQDLVGMDIYSPVWCRSDGAEQAFIQGGMY
jgi:hypothetical protein